MAGERRKFRREGEEIRRDALITAALDLIAEGGRGAATVRAIAARAGVTQGLIRHYFHSKEDLTREAYHTLMSRLTEGSLALLDSAPPSPEGRLAAFVVASLRPPIIDGRTMSLWAGFINQVQSDPAMKAVHKESYLHFRNLLEGMIAALPGKVSPEKARTHAIACNAILDGLWLEGSALPGSFGEDELAQIGITAVGAVLGIDLAAYLPATLPLTATSTETDQR